MITTTTPAQANKTERAELAKAILARALASRKQSAQPETLILSGTIMPADGYEDCMKELARQRSEATKTSSRVSTP